MFVRDIRVKAMTNLYFKLFKIEITFKNFHFYCVRKKSHKDKSRFLLDLMESGGEHT